MRKLVLQCFLSPGDIVMLTAAVRDLHRCHPGQFLTDVRTSCPALWEHNPHLSPLDEHAPDVEVIPCETPLIERCNEAPFHYLHAFADFLNHRLGLQIVPTVFKGDIHLSPEETTWTSQVRELTGSAAPFWIVAAGGKFDATVKWWSRDRYQAVVDHFRGRILFAQVGEVGHYHPPLDGVLDLRGQTDLRQLIRLVYHAQGVLGPVTALMHLAAAVPSPAEGPAERPCVVIAGGREPVHWEAYPTHQFIHTLGALPCCGSGGCWRSRTEPLGDGNERDSADHLCLDVQDGMPRCMHLITAEEVIRRIGCYFRGGVVRQLTPAEASDFAPFITRLDAGAQDREPLRIQTVRRRTREFLESVPPYPVDRHTGRGIVICAGGLTLFTSAWICIRRLRQLGCTLPIQLWHLGPTELDERMRALVEPQGVLCVDALAGDQAQGPPGRRLRGWPLKAHALLHSSFQEVLLLDADNVPVRNPEFLFDAPEYLEAGSVFWWDQCGDEPPPAVWEFCGIPYLAESGFESGQVLVDKARAWRALALADWYNQHHEFFYEHIYGDKETFHLAWRRLNQPFASPARRLENLGTLAMCHHDFDGRRLFQHRNCDKWRLHGPNTLVHDFWFEAESRALLDELRARWDGTRRGFDARQPARTPSEQAAAAELIAHVYEYRRPGEPSRMLAFREDAFVAGGSTGLELYWRVVTEDGAPTLQIASERRTTLALQPETPTVWAGSSTGSDPVPIWLRRVAPCRAPLPGRSRIQPVMISCGARAPVLERTLAHFATTDWSGPAPIIVLDSSAAGDPLVRILETTRRALETALATGTDLVLFLEDDLEFNRFLGSNLAGWPPLVRGELSFATLYDPGIRSIRSYADSPADHAACLEPETVWGSQAFLIARATVEHMLAAWETPAVHGLNSDLRMARLAAQVGPLLGHAPSLVEHLPTLSTWGGISHSALDFRRYWQSPWRNQKSPPTDSLPARLAVAALATADGDPADAFWESCRRHRILAVALGQEPGPWTPARALQRVRQFAHEHLAEAECLIVADVSRSLCDASLDSTLRRFNRLKTPLVFANALDAAETSSGPLPGGPWWIGQAAAICDLLDPLPLEDAWPRGTILEALATRFAKTGIRWSLDPNCSLGLRASTA